MRKPRVYGVFLLFALACDMQNKKFFNIFVKYT